jgi:hypothetical protein
MPGGGADKKNSEAGEGPRSNLNAISCNEKKVCTGRDLVVTALGRAGVQQRKLDLQHTRKNLKEH